MIEWHPPPAQRERNLSPSGGPMKMRSFVAAAFGVMLALSTLAGCGNPCQDACDKIKSCTGLAGTCTSNDCTGKTQCAADCTNAASCDDIKTASASYAMCLSKCQ